MFLHNGAIDISNIDHFNKLEQPLVPTESKTTSALWTTKYHTLSFQISSYFCSDMYFLYSFSCDRSL